MGRQVLPAGMVGSVRIQRLADRRNYLIRGDRLPRRARGDALDAPAGTTDGERRKGARVSVTRYRYLGNRSTHPYAGIALTCDHCKVEWVGCAAESCCPECWAPKGYHGDDWDRCFCEVCVPRDPEPAA